MFNIRKIEEPTSLMEAFQLLSSNTRLKVIAGGTDVLIRLRHELSDEFELLSLRNIPHLDEIHLLEDGTITIGAMCTFSDLYRNEHINKSIPVLSDAAVSMGGPQIRNIATIGGNICNGAVSADSAPTLFSLNATLRLESENGERMIPIQKFYEGPGKVKLLPGEILTHIHITKENYLGLTGHYIKFSNRKAMDIAMLSVAVVCKIENDCFTDLRISLGVASPTPVRCTLAEEFAKGQIVDENVIKTIGEYALKDARPRDSWRGSKMYREHLIQVLTQRAIHQCMKKGGIVHEEN